MIHSSKVPVDVRKVSHLHNDRDLTSWEGFVLENFKQSMAVTEPATCTAMQLRVAPIAQANPITQ